MASPEKIQNPFAEEAENESRNQNIWGEFQQGVQVGPGEDQKTQGKLRRLGRHTLAILGVPGPQGLPPVTFMTLSGSLLRKKWQRIDIPGLKQARGGH